MKIAFFVTAVAVPSGWENNVSAHAQIPLRAMQLLRDAGQTVELITTEMRPGEVWPSCLPNIPVHQVVDARRQHRGESRIRPLTLLAQVRAIRRIVEREGYDVLHFHGSCRLPELAFLVGLPGMPLPIVATLNDGDVPKRFWGIRRRFWKRVSAFMTSTEFIAERLRRSGIEAQVIRHGLVRDLKAELADITPREPHRVLFWRDASLRNGADVCLEAYRRLAPKFPHVSFDAAVRNDHWADWTSVLQTLEREHANVHVHVFPYQDGAGLPQLLAESLCVLLPFRALSYHPQLSILESIQFGVPVITTALDSSLELAAGGSVAVLVPPGDVEATVASVEKMLRDPFAARAFGQAARIQSCASWNWELYAAQLIHVLETACAPTVPARVEVV
jgi:glycosyltransferase involved in cell wall biosynthesis